MGIGNKLYTHSEMAFVPLVATSHAHRLSNWLWIVSGIL